MAAEGVINSILYTTQGEWEDQPLWARENARCSARGDKTIEPESMRNFTQALPMATVTRVNWFMVNEDMHPNTESWAQEGLTIRSRSFQV